MLTAPKMEYCNVKTVPVYVGVNEHGIRFVLIVCCKV